MSNGTGLPGNGCDHNSMGPGAFDLAWSGASPVGDAWLMTGVDDS